MSRNNKHPSKANGKRDDKGADGAGAGTAEEEPVTKIRKTKVPVRKSKA